MSPPRLVLASLALALCLGSQARADLIVGHTDPISGLGSPFSVGYTDEYEQVYTAHNFQGITTIHALSFATVQLGNIGPIEPQTLTFTLSLSTTRITPSTISTSFAANRGADNTQVFSGTITYTPTRNFVVDLTIPTSAFVYDPSKGNLLMDINVTSGAGGFGPNPPAILNGFAADTSGREMARLYVQHPQGPGTPGVNAYDGVGLVTEFGSSVVSLAVPEPSSLALAAIGVAGLAMLGRRRTGG